MNWQLKVTHIWVAFSHKSEKEIRRETRGKKIMGYLTADTAPLSEL